MEDEFVTGMRLGALHKKGEALASLNAIFNKLDANNDGVLTKEELRQLHPELFEQKKFKETLPAMMEKTGANMSVHSRSE